MLPVFRSASVLCRHPALLKQHAAALSALNSRAHALNARVSQDKCQQLVPSSQSVRPAATAAAAAEHNHGKKWAFERIITLGLVGMIPASFMVYHPSMDYILALALCMHSHWGLHGICCDYIRPKLFGAALAKFAEIIVYILSAAAFGCVMYFNYTDIGLIPAFRMLWKL